MRYLLVISSIVLIILTECRSFSTRKNIPTILRGNDSEIRDRILTKIPRGTLQVEAERILEANELDCSNEIKYTTKQPFLLCSYSDNSDLWVTWVWMINIDCPRGRVSAISVNVGGIGL